MAVEAKPITTANTQATTPAATALAAKLPFFFFALFLRVT